MITGMDPFCFTAYHSPAQAFLWSFQLCGCHSMTRTREDFLTGKHLEQAMWKPRQVRKAITERLTMNTLGHRTRNEMLLERTLKSEAKVNVC